MSRSPRHSAGVAARRLVAPVVAVLAVVALIGALLFLGHHSTPPGHPTAARQSDTRAVSLPPGTTAPDSASLGTSLPASPPPSPSSTGSRLRAKPSPAATTGRTQRPARRQSTAVPVTVLNNSRVQGLAHRVAAEVAGRGWPIAQVGNFRGRLAETTLFYLPGQYAAAQRLAAEFPGSAGVYRIEERPAGLPGSGMTLVVTRYWES